MVYLSWLKIPARNHFDPLWKAILKSLLLLLPGSVQLRNNACMIMSCRIFVEMQKTIFILNFGPDFFRTPPPLARKILTTSQGARFFCAASLIAIQFRVVSLAAPDCVKRNWRKRKCLYYYQAWHANILAWDYDCFSCKMIGFHPRASCWAKLKKSHGDQVRLHFLPCQHCHCHSFCWTQTKYYSWQWLQSSNISTHTKKICVFATIII